MVRLVTVVTAVVALIPNVAAMQGLPASPTTLEAPASPMPMAIPPTPPAVDSQPSAQTPRPQQAPPRTPQTVPTPAPPTVAAPVAAVPAPRRPRGRDLNIQLELTISDQLGTAPADKRIVSMLVADAAFGRIRSNVSLTSPGPSVASLNVDARPEVLDNDRVLVELTIEYRPAPPDPAAPAAGKRLADLNQQLTVVLQNGKPLLISQAADPLNDRKMTIEVRANILK